MTPSTLGSHGPTGGGEASSNGALTAKESNVGQSIKLNGTLKKAKATIVARKSAAVLRETGRISRIGLARSSSEKKTLVREEALNIPLRLKKGVLGKLQRSISQGCKFRRTHRRGRIGAGQRAWRVEG